jgi:3-phenylpropionate/trans-cinnamate dioxygenase ferredoxin subunit
VVVVGGRSIVVFNVEGNLYAVRNTCPHHGAELACGTIGGTMLASKPHEYVFGLRNRVLRCPWHGWEFDLATGRSLFAPEQTRVKTYPVFVDGGGVVVDA